MNLHVQAVWRSKEISWGIASTFFLQAFETHDERNCFTYLCSLIDPQQHKIHTSPFIKSLDA